MLIKWMIIPAILVIAIIIYVGTAMSNVETPKYKVISKHENIELRQYQPMIIAEVTTKGERSQAINDGFRILADYIFGNNTVNQKIAMTAPVQQQTSQKIAMTAPVQQQGSEDGWQVSFVLPSEYDIASIPKPNNQQVTLTEIPSKGFIAIRFSGTNSDSNLEKHENELMSYILEKEINVIGAPKYAYYNNPWTLPFMRRNEIMIEISPTEPESKPEPESDL